MAESSSTSSGSRSRASASPTTSSLTTTTNPPVVSITSSFVPPPPLSTSTGFSGGGNGNGNGNGFNGGGNSIASSASLYLYTFLATLVLLLSVSAAIVVRSFLLRRRHRQMIEEAIRNGTWIPPTPGGRGPRVDLSKKPLMWEAYLDIHNNQNQNQAHQQSSVMLDERDWESMKPVMATYVSEPVASKAQNGSGAATGGGAGGGVGDVGSGDSGGSQGGTARMGVPARFLRAFSRRARGVSGNSPSEPTLPRTHPVLNGSGNNTRQGSAVNLSAPAQDVPMSEITPPEPPRVRVAVLIAMPRPHSTSASSNSSSSSSSSSSPPPQIPTLEDEEELPHIEMGVAELNVSDSHLSGMGTDDLRMGAKGKARESMTSGISV